MKYLNISLLAILGFASFCNVSRQNNKHLHDGFSNLPDYVINIRHFIGVEGEMLKWKITKDRVRITYNCDWEGCHDTLFYQAIVDSITSRNYLTAIRTIALEKLKGAYANKGLRDGLYVNFEAQNVFDKPLKFSLHGIKF